MLGLAFALIGAGAAAGIAGVGSAIGVTIAGQGAAGVVSEDPDKFGRVLVFTALPGSQGIYGFLAAVIIANTTGVLSGSPLDITVGQGLEIFGAAIPVALACLFSAIYQGKLAAAGINLSTKQPDATGKGVILAAFVETYAILGLLVTILIVNGLGIGQ